MANSSYRVYVTFSGESSKIDDAAPPADASVDTEPIDNVKALSRKGNDKGDVLPKGGAYAELRGMAVDAQGRLYVANAQKSGSSIDVFGPAGKDGTRPLLVSGLITESSSSALWHPYQLAFDGSTLFVSSQDTNVVSAYTITGNGTETSAAPAATCSYLSSQFGGPFFEGTWVASSVAVPHGGVTPEAIAATQGGLAMTTEPARHSVRGIALAGAQLFVADEAGGRVAVYDLATGTYQSAVTGVGSTAIVNPVGLAVNPQSGAVAIGSAGNDVLFLYVPSTTALSVLYDAGADGYSQISGLAWSPDGETLYFASRKKRRVYALDVASGRVSKFSKKFDDSPECLLVVAS
jgi:DNA-binding beta-propeller fold protein YncE